MLDCQLLLRYAGGMNAHLLINVFITPVGLSKFKINKIKDNSSTFRIDRFLTACSTFNSVPWKSITIFIKLDPCWSHLQSDVNHALKRIFPSASIENHRLEKRSEWQKISQKYPDEDSIFLQANDDHAVVCQDSQYLIQYIETFCNNTQFNIGALTHFPEMQSLVLKKTNNLTSPNTNFSSGRIHYAIGTQLVRSSFFKSWWEKGKIKDDTYIFRPDNPFGESITFESIEMLIPQKELFRHMDGYGHIGMHRPLGPLRNLGTLQEFNDPKFQIQNWKRGLWPSRIRAYSGSGYDIHETHSELKGFRQLRVGVALLQSHWALKYMPDRSKSILSSINISNRPKVYLISLIATLSLPIVRNVPDFFIEQLSIKLAKLAKKFLGINNVYRPSYLGVWRSARQKMFLLKKRITF